VGEITWLWG